MASFTVKNIDALEYIKNLKIDGNVEIFDAIITDPPYNISRENNFSTIGRQGIKFGSWDYNFDQTTWIYEITPLIKKGGSIIIFNDYKNMGEICKSLEENGFEIKDLIRWVKNNPMPRNTERRYVTDFEFAIWAVKPGKKWTFNKSKKSSYLRPEFKYPIVAPGKNKIHPTQKNEDLLKDLISIHTNKGDLIYDPFMGSASTGIASLKLDRIFFGTELDKNYFDKAEERLTDLFKEQIKNKKVTRSPLYYLGDKYKLLPYIVNIFPSKIETFYDVFGGGGTMLANINAKKYVYNDIDKNLPDLLIWMKENSFAKIIKAITDNIRKYNLTYFKFNNRDPKYLKERNTEGFKKLKLFFNQNKDSLSFFEKNSLLITLIFYGFNSQLRFNSLGEFNIPIGKQDLNINREGILKSFVNKIKQKNIIFFSKDFSFILEHDFDENDFLYFDPPYSITTATYNTSWNDDDDERLFEVLDILNEKKIKWALSNVLESGKKINLALKKWSSKYYTYKLDYNYNNSSYQKIEKGGVEVLITNTARDVK